MTRARQISTLAVIALYWALLVAGMAMCLVVRGDDSHALAPIWSGVVVGTVLGHTLAVLRFRLRVVVLAAIAISVFLLPSTRGAGHMWSAFLPATLCAFWSLGDRAALVAFWFPTVLWMLPILDHARPDSVPDDPGLAMLGGLAVAFVVFLRVREARRVALWREVSPAPLATAAPLVVLRERPGARFARTGWSLGASALAFAATAAVAPKLWHSEPTTSDAMPEIAGLRCCPHDLTVEAPQARVKEYFDLGRGHPTEVTLRPGIDCRRCEATLPTFASEDVPRSYGYGNDYAQMRRDWPSRPTRPSLPPRYEGATASGNMSGGYAAPSFDVPPAPAPVPLPEATPAPAAAPSATYTLNPPPAVPALDTQQYVAPPPVPVPAPVAAAPPPPPAPVVTAPTPAAPVVTEPAPGPTAAPHMPAPGSSLLGWIAIVLGGVLASQLVLLALRPLRRLVTLRHLRRPFWNETVDQRVSNAWQLALVGLRDAGWRSHGQESPSELARRAGVDGLDGAATILERARHGVGIDQGDLDTIVSASDTAYHAARRRLGPVARAVSWLRWPLV